MRRLDVIVAGLVCRAAYAQVGRSIVVADTVTECVQRFDEIDGSGEELRHILSSPVLMRRQRIMEFGRCHGMLEERSNELCHAVCEMAEPLLPYACRVLCAVAHEMAELAT